MTQITKQAPQTEAQKRAAQEAKAELQKTFRSVSVMYVKDPDAHQIQLPEGMSYQTAREWLIKIEKEETREVQWSFKFKGWFPFDAMWAVYRAMAKKYGFAHVADFQGFWGPTPPSSITIQTGYSTTQQMPWGPIEVSGVSSPLEPQINFDQGLPCLLLGAVIKNSEKHLVDEIVAIAEDILKTDSIYRGKAIDVDFTIFNRDDIRFDAGRAPKFMDTSIQPQDLILSADVERRIDVSLWSPIRNAQVCREQKVPLRRGVLLAGKYGVGKTLTARLTAKTCQDNGWTFLYLRDLSQLSQALYFAKKYEPCVIFAEDINRVVSGARNDEMDKIFNVVDGVDRKNDEVMIVFTTNNIEEIHPGMLRPGRIDDVITVRAPDAAAAARLIQYYGRGLIEEGADVTAVGVKLAGQIPAIIRECVERSKLAAIGDTKPGEQLIVRAEHLSVAADQMLEHANLLLEPAAPKPDLVILGEAIGNVIGKGVEAHFNSNGKDYSDDTKLAPKHLLDVAGRPKNGASNGSNGHHPAG